MALYKEKSEELKAKTKARQKVTGFDKCKSEMGDQSEGMKSNDRSDTIGEDDGEVEGGGNGGVGEDGKAGADDSNTDDSDSNSDGSDGDGSGSGSESETEGWWEHDLVLPTYDVPSCIPSLDLVNMPTPEPDEEVSVEADGSGEAKPGFIHWGVTEVCNNLGVAGFKQYVNIARAARLDGACLARMTQQQFEGLGVKSEHVQQIMDMLTTLSAKQGGVGEGEGEDAGDSVVLEEKIDPDYVPTEAEILEYAEFLGMDVEKEGGELLWIAREGLTTKIPPEWKPCKTKDTQEIYYFNFETGESIWEHPVDMVRALLSAGASVTRI